MNFLSRKGKFLLGCGVRVLSSLANGEFDVVVAGGGMVGNTFGCSCATESSSVMGGKKVLILEAAPEISHSFSKHAPYSNRVSAVNPTSKKFFEKLGVWNCMESARVKSVKQLQVWESCSESRTHFEHPNFESEVAFIVENNLIAGSLLKRIQSACPNVTVQHGARVKGYRLPESLSELVEIELEDGNLIKAKLLVGADGANSLVRKTMGVRHIGWEYGQKGIVATLKLTEWENSQQNSLANKGLFAVSKFFEFIGPDIPNAVQLPPTIVSVEKGSRAAFPLGLGHALNYVKPRVVLIGDAAHRIHPLAGQGVNLGFADAACLSEILERAASRGADLESERSMDDEQLEDELRSPRSGRAGAAVCERRNCSFVSSSDLKDSDPFGLDEFFKSLNSISVR